MKKSDPPKIWTFNTIDDEEARDLAERVLFCGLRNENEGQADALIRLLAGIAAYHECECKGAICIESVTWSAIKLAFTQTQQFNDSFFDYAVNDLKIARDFREKGKGDE